MIMASTRILVLFVAMLTASFTWAASGGPCEKPDKPNLPNGNQASQEEMVQTGRDVREYVEASRKRLKCLEQQEAKLGEEITKEQKALISKLYNDTVSNMKTVADNYNRQVRLWKGEDPDKPASAQDGEPQSSQSQQSG